MTDLRWVRWLFGPLDPFDDATNGDPDSWLGDENPEGFDDMPLENGWEDEGDDDEDDEDDEDGDDDE